MRAGYRITEKGVERAKAYDEDGVLKVEMARWMSAPLVPLQANADAMKPAIAAIEDRLFTVELYAGLCEEIEQIRKGEPAKLQEKIRIFQDMPPSQPQQVVFKGGTLKMSVAFKGFEVGEPEPDTDLALVQAARDRMFPPAVIPGPYYLEWGAWFDGVEGAVCHVGEYPLDYFTIDNIGQKDLVVQTNPEAWVDLPVVWTDRRFTFPVKEIP